MTLATMCVMFTGGVIGAIVCGIVLYPIAFVRGSKAADERNKKRAEKEDQPK